MEMERELLLLGLLRGDEMHGYQLNEFIDSHLDLMVHLKPPTAYRMLDKMTDRGWVTYREEREGNRPPRRVFAITSEGEKAFQRLLRTSLAKFEPIISTGNIGLLFLQVLPKAEAAELLQARRVQVEGALRQVLAHEAHPESASFLLLHQARHLEAELEWLDEIIDQVESQEALKSTPQKH
jgi:DNA-binding PadR family transcriptional regulator